jgi:hypothetical protein
MPTRPKTGLLLFFSGSSAPSVYTISGTVYDANGSTPVEGATVALGLLTATSAANGTYSIASVPAGASGSMTCTLAGYSWTAITVAAMSGNLTGQDYDNAWWAAGGCAASCVAAYRAIGAADIAASYVNLANPGTLNAAPGTAPTFAAASGWTFNGTDQYLTTGIVPASNHSAFMRFSDFSYSASHIIPFGQRKGANDGMFVLLANPASPNVFQYNYGTRPSTAPVSGRTAGVVGMAGTKSYWNGVDDGADTSATLTAQTQGMLLGAWSDNGTPSQFTALKMQAYAHYSAALTSAQALAIASAMAGLGF